RRADRREHADRLSGFRVAGRGPRLEDGYRRDRQMAGRDDARVGSADQDERRGEGARRRHVGVIGTGSRGGVMRTIMLMNAKGGCGKSTLATSLASHYANQGLKVALADYDPQGSSMDWLAVRSPD